MRSWTSDNPKASLMKRKRAAIVDSALQEFLDCGYSQASMDHIASAAGVSVKTVYRHFENKDDLFSTVMKAACSPNGFEVLDDVEEEESLPEKPWFSEPPGIAFVMAGIDYLQHALMKEQLALYRVVTQDAHRFPGLGSIYREEVLQKRNDIFTCYLNRWAELEHWEIKDSRRAAATFAALLRADIFEDALHGLHNPDSSEISARASFAADNMLILLKAGAL